MRRGTQRIARKAWICTAALTAAAAISAVAPGFASAANLGKFQHCPKDNPELATESGGCVVAQSQFDASKWKQPEPPSGLQAGNVTIPFVKPVVLQGGFSGLSSEPVPLIGPEDGAARLVPAAEPVPGGLAGEIDVSKLHGATLAAYEAAIAHHRTKVTATIEIAPTSALVFLNAAFLLTAEGTFLTLPLKVKFSNEFLGEHCYSGSDVAPIMTELTDGTTAPPPPGEPISGQLGRLRFTEEVISIKEDSLVSNNFEAPAVQGCGREPAWQAEVDEAINSKAGLPSPPGANSTRIDGKQTLVGVETLRQKGL